MPGFRKTYAYNRTRQAFLASELRIADTHWSRLKGLIGTTLQDFASGQGLWIVPSQGVHTMLMRYPIDVLYLDAGNRVLHIEENVQPWRVTPVNMEAATVLELPSRTLWNTGTAVGDEIEIEQVPEEQATA